MLLVARPGHPDYPAVEFENRMQEGGSIYGAFWHANYASTFYQNIPDIGVSGQQTAYIWGCDVISPPQYYYSDRLLPDIVVSGGGTRQVFTPNAPSACLNGFQTWGGMARAIWQDNDKTNFRYGFRTNYDPDLCTAQLENGFNWGATWVDFAGRQNNDGFSFRLAGPGTSGEIENYRYLVGEWHGYNPHETPNYVPSAFSDWGTNAYHTDEWNAYAASGLLFTNEHNGRQKAAGLPVFTGEISGTTYNIVVVPDYDIDSNSINYHCLYSTYDARYYDGSTYRKFTKCQEKPATSAEMTDGAISPQKTAYSFYPDWWEGNKYEFRLPGLGNMKRGARIGVGDSSFRLSKFIPPTNSDITYYINPSGSKTETDQWGWMMGGFSVCSLVY